LWQKTCLAVVSVLVELELVELKLELVELELELELAALVAPLVVVLVALPVAVLELALEAQLVEVLEASQEVVLQHDPRREASSRRAKNDRNVTEFRRKARSCPFHKCLFRQ